MLVLWHPAGWPKGRRVVGLSVAMYLGICSRPLPQGMALTPFVHIHRIPQLAFQWVYHLISPSQDGRSSYSAITLSPKRACSVSACLAFYIVLSVVALVSRCDFRPHSVVAPGGLSRCHSLLFSVRNSACHAPGLSGQSCVGFLLLQPVSPRLGARPAVAAVSRCPPRRVCAQIFSAVSLAPAVTRVYRCLSVL